MEGPVHQPRLGKASGTFFVTEAGWGVSQAEANGAGEAPGGLSGGIPPSDFCSKMLLWLRVGGGPRAEGGSGETRQEAVAVTPGEAWDRGHSSGWRRTLGLGSHRRGHRVWALREPEESGWFWGLLRPSFGPVKCEVSVEVQSHPRTWSSRETPGFVENNI